MSKSAIKRMFFDRQAVIDAVGRPKRKCLPKAGRSSGVERDRPCGDRVGPADRANHRRGKPESSATTCSFPSTRLAAPSSSARLALSRGITVGMVGPWPGRNPKCWKPVAR